MTSYCKSGGEEIHNSGEEMTSQKYDVINPVKKFISREEIHKLVIFGVTAHAKWLQPPLALSCGNSLALKTSFVFTALVYCIGLYC
jgi:hypothetical protein